ncbi:MAG: hypothetical protein PHG87_07125 [Candidatus Omnitrophica bacterium]|nr:hypothetical protein [Candidatus Omnitrophota bacterium]
MGIVHKLKPEVLNFILENKQRDSTLSCRTLTQLILEKLQIKVSKSSINSIFKEHNLSMPVGRRQKVKKRKFNLPILPVIEGTKAITLVTAPQRIEPKVAEGAGKEGIIKKEKKEEISLEEKRIKEAEEWAMKLQDEERARVEQRLNLEKQRVENDAKRKADEAEVKVLLEEAARVKAQEELKLRQQEKAAQEAAEKKRLEEKNLKRIEEERAAQEAAKKAEEEKAAQEAALKAEKEKWARLAEEELKVRQQKEKMPQERICSGAILLKALDSLIGGSREINAAICKKLGVAPEESLNLTEAVIFRSLFGKDNLAGLCDLIGQQYSQERLDNYSSQIKGIENIKSEINGIISAAFTEARGVKVHFIDGSVIHLDGQLHSTWSTQYVPYDFSSPASELKNSLNKYFFENRPLVLFSAPGYDIAPKDFFSLLLNIGSTDKYPDNLILFGNKLEEIEKISLGNKNKYSLVFGLWPWQFTSSRKVRKIGNFDLRRIEGIDKDLYLAEIEIDLLRVPLDQSVTLKGCAIKTTPAEKIRLVVLSNPEKPLSLDELAGIYLNRWPNFEEAFQDFNRKIELFSYTGNEQKFLSKDRFEFGAQGSNLELRDIFANYIRMLDLYLRWHFLPAEYTEKDLSFTSKNFYQIPVLITVGPGKIRAKIQLDQGHEFLKDLKYLVCRLNERQIDLLNGTRLYFETVLK